MCVCVWLFFLFHLFFFLVAVICKVSASLSIKIGFSFCNMISLQTCSLIESSFEWHLKNALLPQKRFSNPGVLHAHLPAVWLAASYHRLFLSVPNPFYIWGPVLEKTSHANYSGLFLGSNVPKSQKQKSQKQYEAWYWWTIKSEFHLIILLCSWIHHPFQLWAHQPWLCLPASWHHCHSTDGEWEMQWDRPNCPKARWPSWNREPAPLTSLQVLAVWQHSLEERARR